ncbi:MAG: SCP2 sterol-binding domain-containing protein, partial [Alphaproteobacteria bacterium]|nr:SCP2 sterol-binding domain-containing protein [Alphaproteobacteria bacterium]
SGRGVVPGFVRSLVRPLPRLPLALALTHIVRRLAARRPEVFERLAPYDALSLLIDPSDLPFGFRVTLAGMRSQVDIVADTMPCDVAARVRAPLLVLTGLLDGTYDADALFFSRDLVIEGDTEAVLAVRNAIEEAELSPAELLGLAGAPARLLDRAAGDGLSLLRRKLGAPAPSFAAREL